MQNTMNTFPEAGCYLNIKFDHHSNIFAAALGLDYCRVRTQGNKICVYNASSVQWNHSDADIICLALKEPLET